MKGNSVSDPVTVFKMVVPVSAWKIQVCCQRGEHGIPSYGGPLNSLACHNTHKRNSNKDQRSMSDIGWTKTEFLWLLVATSLNRRPQTQCGNLIIPCSCGTSPSIFELPPPDEVTSHNSARSSWRIAATCKGSAVCPLAHRAKLRVRVLISTCVESFYTRGD